MTKMIRVRKRYFLILEVLIAFALIVLCLFPLLVPQVFILKSQARFINKVKLDHLVNLLYGHVTKELFINRIEWKDIEGQTTFPITQDEVANLGFPPLFKDGYYNLKIVDQKPKIKENEPEPTYFLYVLALTFSFKINEQDEKPANYTYNIFVARNLEGASPTSER